MVYPGAIPSPGADTTAFEGRDDFSNPDLGSMVESFQSPGRDRDVFARASTAAGGGKRRTLATPQRQVFGSLTNRHAAGGAAARNEFTPLLKSVHRSTLKQKIGGERFGQDFSRPSLAGSSPALPVGSPGDSTTFRTQDEGEDDETVGPGQGLPDSSLGSTPLGPRAGGSAAGGNGAGAGGAGPLGGDGLMTLREQEKVIDDIKKENFSLKLKVFFLNERLDKLGPEHRDAALKEVSAPPLPLFSWVTGRKGEWTVD